MSRFRYDGVETWICFGLKLLPSSVRQPWKEPVPPDFHLKSQQDILSSVSIIGQNSRFCWITFGGGCPSDNHYIARIIEQYPHPDLPVLAALSLLHWLSYRRLSALWIYPGYWNSLINTFGIPAAHGSDTGILPNFLIPVLAKTWMPVLYYWTLEIIDEFGNSSRVNEGTFVIRPEK